MVESTSFLEHFELNHTPFGPEPDTRIFYQGAGHPAVLHSLLNDIHTGRPLTKLTGSEGVGKSLVALLLAERLPAEIFEIIVLDHPAGSYEDLLRVICRAVDRGGEENAVPIQYHRVFREILQRKKNQQKKVLLIIDEAEKIFLATLERLVKTICDTDEAEVLQILLIGRLELDNNLEQLKVYCTNVDIHIGYTIAPLDEKQTKEYLQYRLQAAGIPATQKTTVFDGEAVSAIYQVAQGNIRRTNSLAEKGLKEAWENGATRVAPEWIAPRRYLQQNEHSMLSGLGSSIVRNKWWSAFGVFMLLLFFTLIFSGRQEETTGNMMEVEPPLEDMVIEKPAIVIPEEKELSRVTEPEKKAESVIEKTREMKQPPAEEKTSIAENPEKILPSETDLAEEEQPVPAETGSMENVPQEKPSVAEPAEREPPDILTPREIKKKAEVAQTDLVVVEAQGKKKKVQIPGEKSKEIKQEKKSSADPEEMFDERLRATSNWLAWSYRGGYTIQLMMLTADDAEENLKNIIVQEEYSPIRNDIYIIKRNSPPAYFVYYGMYETMEAARQARNNLPMVLRGHRPYALSIEEALEKAK